MASMGVVELLMVFDLFSFYDLGSTTKFWTLLWASKEHKDFCGLLFTLSPLIFLLFNGGTFVYLLFLYSTYL